MTATTRRFAGVLVAVGLLLAASALPAEAEAVPAEGPALPGMCNGRTAPNVVVNAHDVGPVKFVLNVTTDATGAPSGVLILDQGPNRVLVEQICRVWQHLPGQEPGGGCEGGEIPEGATIVHAVGVGRLRDGTSVVVRADLRETEEGRVFRVRYRAMGDHDDHGELEAAAHDDDGCDGEDDSWTRVPADGGWAQLDRLRVAVVGTA